MCPRFFHLSFSLGASLQMRLVKKKKVRKRVLALKVELNPILEGGANLFPQPHPEQSAKIDGIKINFKV